MAEIFFMLIRLNLTGTTLFIALCVLSIIVRKYLTITWQYILRFVIFIFFIIPFSLVNTLIISIKHIFSLLSKSEENITYTTDMIISSIDKNDYESIKKISLIILDCIEYLSIIWFIGMIIYFIWQLICIFILKKIIKNGSYIVSGELKDLVNTCKEKMKIKREVLIIQSEYFKTPMITGLVKPKLLLPNSMKVDQSTEFIIKHELTHWIHHDTFIKVICMIIKAIHWYNPFVYILCKQLNFWCEIYCDECVTQILTEDEKKQYIKTLINSISIPKKNNIQVLIAFKDTKYNFKRRIEYMIRKQRTSKIASALIALILISMGVTTVYAEDIIITDIKQNIYVNSDIANDIQLYTDIKEEYHLYSEKVSDVNIMNAEDVTILADFTNFNWSIASGTSAKGTNESWKKGDNVYISASWKNATNDVKIGITNGTTFYYYYATGGYFSGLIEIPSDGRYQLRIENLGSSTITINGHYTLN